VLTKLKQCNNPKLKMQEALAYGCHNGESYVLVTGLLGPDLLAVGKLGGASGRHSERNVLVLAEQALVLFQELHAAKFLHRDIKPENLVLGVAGTAGARKLHLIDFGTAESLVDRNGLRRTTPQAAEGSLPYMAVTVQQKQPLGKRDDVEALIWTLLRLFLGELPWEKGGKATLASMLPHKMRVRNNGVKSEPACKHMQDYLATCFDAMLAHLCTLTHPESEPDYAALRKHVQTAWKSAAFQPSSVAKADVDYPGI
jgi:serine/threonine protein kinase